MDHTLDEDVSDNIEELVPVITKCMGVKSYEYIAMVVHLHMMIGDIQSLRISTTIW